MPMDEPGQEEVPLYLQEILRKFSEPILEELLELKKAAWANSILQKPFLTFDEACQYLEISKSCLYKLTSGCLIPHYSPRGKFIYFKREELEEYVLQNRRGTVAESMAKKGGKLG